jgi:hypothetical protein
VKSTRKLTHAHTHIPTKKNQSFNKNSQYTSLSRCWTGRGGTYLRATRILTPETLIPEQVFDWSGEYLQTIGEEGESTVEIECPWGLAVDGDCCIFVGDIGSVHRMRDME